MRCNDKHIASASRSSESSTCSGWRAAILLTTVFASLRDIGVLIMRRRMNIVSVYRPSRPGSHADESFQPVTIKVHGVEFLRRFSSRLFNSMSAPGRRQKSSLVAQIGLLAGVVCSCVGCNFVSTIRFALSRDSLKNPVFAPPGGGQSKPPSLLLFCRNSATCPVRCRARARSAAPTRESALIGGTPRPSPPPRCPHSWSHGGFAR